MTVSPRKKNARNMNTLSITSSSQTKRNKCCPSTPIRFKTRTPRISPATPYIQPSTPRRRNTPSSINSYDRFIPNRSRFDSSETRASLLKSKTAAAEKEAEDRQVPQEYKQQLRRALFGAEEPTSLLGFGKSNNRMSAPGSESKRGNQTVHTPEIISTSQNILRLDNSLSTRRHKRKRIISNEPLFVREVPDICTDDRLNLVSVGPAIAVPIDGIVFLSTPRDVSCIPFNTSDRITSLKWAPAEKEEHIALGGKEEAQVWDAATKQPLAELFNHQGYVTALEWRGANSLLAASSVGIQQYDLRMTFPEVQKFNPVNHRECHPVTKIQWEGELLAAAAGDTISLWDIRHSARPLRCMHHKECKALGFCPTQRNVLTTGGSDGIKVWNFQSGQLRKHIPTSDPVSCLLWSPFEAEVVASYGINFGVWSLSTNANQIAKFACREGRIMSMDFFPKEGRMVSIHDNEAVVGWDLFGKRPNAKKPKTYTGGILDLPAIR